MFPSPFRRLHRGAARLALALVAPLAACGDPFEVTANFDTVEATVTIHAFNDTPVALATGVLVAPLPQAVRPGPDYLFDLAFDVDAGGGAVLLPVDALAAPGVFGGSRVTGIRPVTDQGYDAITRAPAGGYTVGDPVAIAVGDVGVIQAVGHPTCAGSFFGNTIYAKYRVEAIDAAARTLTLRIRVDPNCGFRGLEVGEPTR